MSCRISAQIVGESCDEGEGLRVSVGHVDVLDCDGLALKGNVQLLELGRS